MNILFLIICSKNIGGLLTALNCVILAHVSLKSGVQIVKNKAFDLIRQFENCANGASCIANITGACTDADRWSKFDQPIHRRQVLEDTDTCCKGNKMNRAHRGSVL